MEVCRFCDSFVLGGECTNLNCKHSRELRTKKEKVVKQAALSTPNSSRGSRKKSVKAPYLKHLQLDGRISVPPEIHLQFKDSLPKFMGYKTDKKAENNSRQNTLRTLFEADYVISPNALNQSAIGEFGPPSSEKRKKKLLSWFDGRIAKSQSNNLQNSRQKLIEDREFVSEQF